MPPQKMAAVVPIERYEPTAKLRERMPSSSTAITRNTPSSTSPQGSRRLRMPLITTDISRACGAGASWLPMPWIHCSSTLPVAASARYLPSAMVVDPITLRRV